MEELIEKSTIRPWGGYYILARNGQEHPAQGDRVVVLATIHLPAVEDEDEDLVLQDEITFGERVEVAGNYLRPLWGDEDLKSSTRVVFQEFAADRWSEATQAARAWAEGELGKIDEALKRRAEALANA